MNDGEFTSFIADFNQFKGQFKEFKETTKRRLNETNVSLKNIESEMKNPRVCGAHESILTMLGVVKSEENRQELVNIDQKARNDARTIEQTAQNVKIRDLEEKDRMVEYKMSNHDIAKLTAIFVPLTTIIMFILERLFK